MSANPLETKRVFVTGSSRGIGRIVAERLASLGARVAIHGTSKTSTRSFNEADSLDEVAGEIRNATKAEVVPVTGDLTDPEVVTSVAEEVRAAFSGIDVLVNCAGGDIGAVGVGGANAGKPSGNNALDISVEDVRAVMNRNFMTCVLCCREVVPEMRNRRSGAVVNVGSIAGLWGMEGSAIYASSKAAVHEYTRCLAVHLRPYNVRANVVAPGEVVTPRFVNSRVVDQDRMAEDGDLSRYGRPIEVARVVSFLAGEASSYVSGQVIRVDGGQQCWPS